MWGKQTNLVNSVNQTGFLLFAPQLACAEGLVVEGQSSGHGNPRASEPVSQGLLAQKPVWVLGCAKDWE